jgi:phage terminase small subunit
MKTKKDTKPKLNPKQQKFCEQYAIYRNATKAAELAGYSKKTAYSQGQRLLKNVEIKKAIATILGDATKRAGLALDAVLNELKALAFSSISDFASWGRGTVILTPSEKLSTERLKAVESIAETTDKNGDSQLRLKLHNKLRAIECILKLYEISEIEARIAAIEERLEK